MIKHIYTFLFFLFTWQLALAQNKILINNPSSFERKELISLDYEKLIAKFSIDSIFTVKDIEGNILPIQLEYLGKPSIQNVLILVSLKPKEKKEIFIYKEANPLFDSRTYARKVPERFDDFAWENDVVAFRIYGKALEGRADDAQGIDFWAKRTSNLIIDKWYKSEDYHTDHGEGLDYYSVGKTLGLGDIAIFQNNNLLFTKHYRNYRILDNGPLRTTFVLEYEEQDFNGEKISFTKTISIDAGSYYNKITLNFNNQNNKQTDIVVGLVKRKESEPIYRMKKNWYSLTYWEPEINKSGNTASAIILPHKNVIPILDKKEQFLFKTNVKNNASFRYYNAAAWNRAAVVNSFDQWKQMIDEIEEKQKKPIIIRLK